MTEIFSSAEWARLKIGEPEEFTKAVAFGRAFQENVSKTPMRGVPFLHRSMLPLDQVEFSNASGN